MQIILTFNKYIALARAQCYSWLDYGLLFRDYFWFLQTLLLTNSKFKEWASMDRSLGTNGNEFRHNLMYVLLLTTCTTLVEQAEICEMVMENFLPLKVGQVFTSLGSFVFCCYHFVNTSSVARSHYWELIFQRPQKAGENTNRLNKQAIHNIHNNPCALVLINYPRQTMVFQFITILSVTYNCLLRTTKKTCQCLEAKHKEVSCSCSSPYKYIKALWLKRDNFF